ncbi:phage tail family protein [Paenalkalicoccus suaedae]|uniref:Phage tail family protein n=1 Tax=Paenalkalicoccus suaedae TaxID=2592382 RepID=A0A859FGF4_9BACI|nr:phage tail domain-containing protein [Paenalkalicoccus suaedae]QKS71900.1 phage tail family protein [Paenalkalicoccus suaedae]
MSRKIYLTTSRGKIELSSSSLYILETIEGADSAPKENTLTRSPRQDGAYKTASHYEPRYMVFQGAIKTKEALSIAEKRKFLQNILSTNEIEVEYVDATGAYFIDATLDGEGITFPPRQGGWQYFFIYTVSPDPFWRSDSLVTEPTFEPLFEFVFEDEGEEDGSFEMGLQRDERVVINDGDVGAPVLIEFHGPAENPRIENVTTGKFLQVNQSLGINEIMRIETTFGKKSVKFIDDTNEEERDVLNWIDPQSEFWILKPGENEIVYTADSDIQGAIVDIYYFKRYVGV